MSSNHFFAVHSIFTYDSEAYDLMKLYFKTLLGILVTSLPGSSEPRSDVLTIRPLFHVQCGCRKTVFFCFIVQSHITWLPFD